MKKHLVRLIPSFLRPILRSIYVFPLGIIDRLGNRNSMVPPRSLIYFGGGDFEKIGQLFKGYFIDLANLQPEHRVLDVGCGTGRMAVPLTDYLSEKGEYWGFDIIKKGIEWCQENISKKFRNFHFLHSDVYSRHYNASGKINANEYVFPFDSGYFDLVILTSVFTHMLPPDLENYVAEVSRVLKPGGRCVITFFLMTEESEALIRSGHSSLIFKDRIEGCFTTNRNDPEAAIAYDETDVQEIYRRNGLAITQPTRYGSWCKRKDFLTYQDLIIAAKGQMPPGAG